MGLALTGCRILPTPIFSDARDYRVARGFTVAYKQANQTVGWLQVGGKQCGKGASPAIVYGLVNNISYLYSSGRSYQSIGKTSAVCYAVTSFRHRFNCGNWAGLFTLSNGKDQVSTFLSSSQADPLGVAVGTRGTSNMVCNIGFTIMVSKGDRIRITAWHRLAFCEQS